LLRKCGALTTAVVTRRDPDNPDAKDNFIAISGAYKILSDDQERAYFDSGRSTDSNNRNVNVDDVFSSFFRGKNTGGGAPGGRGGFNFNFGSGGGGGSGGDETDNLFSNMFRSFSFGSGGGGARASAGAGGFGFGGGGDGRPSHAHAQPHNEGTARQVLSRFYAAVGGAKSPDEMATLVTKYRGRYDTLYDKLRAKYGRDPRDFVGAGRPAPPPAPARPKAASPAREKQLREWLQHFYTQHGGRKTAAELQALARKYAGDPAPLYRKLEAKYGSVGRKAW
jgi:hypothetical protein